MSALRTWGVICIVNVIHQPLYDIVYHYAFYPPLGGVGLLNLPMLRAVINGTVKEIRQQTKLCGARKKKRRKKECVFVTELQMYRLMQFQMRN